MSEHPRAIFARKLLRRLPLLVIVVVLASLWLGDRPRELALIWDLPDAPAPVHVEILIHAPDGSIPASISWGDRKQRAADLQPQRAFLAPGLHRFVAKLTFPDGTVTEVSRELEIGPEDERIVIHL